MVDGLELDGVDTTDRVMRNAWQASVAVVGADGMPPPAEAGSVLRPFTSLKLVIRIPPTCDPAVAMAAVARVLTDDPPSGAEVTWEAGMAAGGWAAVPLAPWLAEALEQASQTCFANPAARLGEGGTIPFMRWLAERFPDAQVLAAGVLVPGVQRPRPRRVAPPPDGRAAHRCPRPGARRPRRFSPPADRGRRHPVPPGDHHDGSPGLGRLPA